MAKVSKSVLKSYFEAGDIPTQAQYVDLIDSQFNLAETELQIIDGTLSSSAGSFDYLTLKKAYLPGIGVGSAKVGTTLAIGRSLEVQGTASVDSLQVIGGTISSSGYILTQNITASNHISASGDISATGNITASGKIQSGLINLTHNGIGTGEVGSSFYIGPSLNIKGTIATTGDISSSGYFYGDGSKLSFTNITSSGQISASGAISGSEGLHIDDFSVFVDADTGPSTTYRTEINGGSIKVFGGGLELNTGAIQGNKFQHYGDSNTHLSFPDSNDAALFEIGGDETLHILPSSISASGNITASGYISASEDIRAIRIELSNEIVAGIASSKLYIGNATIPVEIKQNSLAVDADGTSGHITASGNISASGDMSAVTGSFKYVDGTNINFTNITASGDLLFTTGSSGIRSAGSLVFTIEDIGNLGATTEFEVKEGVGNSTIFKVEDNGFAYFYGGIIFGQGADQTLTSKGNMTFVIDYDGDETSQEFRFKDTTSTTVATITDGGDISGSGYSLSAYNRNATEAVFGGNGEAGATALSRITGISFVSTDTSKSHISLGDGNPGQIKHIIHQARTNAVDLVIKPDNFAAGSLLTSNAAGRGCTLIFDGTNWHVLGDVGEFVIS